MPYSRIPNRSSLARDVLARHEVLWAGVLPGVAGGVAMMILAMAAAAEEGLSPLHPLQVMGESFVGPAALEGGALTTFGALVHLATSALLGIVFAAVVPRDHPLPGAMGLGLGVALLAMGLMMSFVTPWANPGLRGGFQAIGGTWVIATALFGLVVGTAPALRRWIGHERTAALHDRGAIHPRATVAPPRNA